MANESHAYMQTHTNLPNPSTFKFIQNNPVTTSLTITTSLQKRCTCTCYFYHQKKAFIFFRGFRAQRSISFKTYRWGKWVSLYAHQRMFLLRDYFLCSKLLAKLLFHGLERTTLCLRNWDLAKCSKSPPVNFVFT